MNFDLEYNQWIIWFAGWFEGEGSIISLDSKRKYGGIYVNLAATSTDLDVLQYIKYYIGGNIYGPFKGQSMITGADFRDRYNWRLSKTDSAIRVARDIYPYLGQRRQIQIDECIDKQKWAKVPSQEERFWSHIQKEDDCMLWDGFIDKFGFGSFSYDGGKKRKQAHRFAFELSSIQAPARLINFCGNKHCVNIEHWLPDSKENRELIHATARDES